MHTDTYFFDTQRVILLHLNIKKSIFFFLKKSMANENKEKDKKNPSKMCN